jgi:nitroreductase
VDLIEAIQTTGATRYFRPDPVPDDVLRRVFDAARFGPQGGNRQPIRYIVVRDAELKRQLAVWYYDIWKSFNEMAARGENPTPHGTAGPLFADDRAHHAAHFADSPVLVVVCAVLADLALTDAQLDRPSVVGGASIYPSVQNLLLAARSEGLGAVLTTRLCRVEPQVKELLGIPAELITCATVPIGYPARALPKKLTRAPVEDFVFADRYGEALFS